MKCPNCGYQNTTKGRPKTIDEKKLKSLYDEGLTIRDIAAVLRVSRSGVHDALIRLKSAPPRVVKTTKKPAL